MKRMSLISYIGNDHSGLAFALAAIFYALCCALILIPLAKVLRRMGLSGWWSLLYLTGIGVIIGSWLLAYCRWPALDRDENSN